MGKIMIDKSGTKPAKKQAELGRRGLEGAFEIRSEIGEEHKLTRRIQGGDGNTQHQCRRLQGTAPALQRECGRLDAVGHGAPDP